jgi:hypothetical protein
MRRVHYFKKPKNRVYIPVAKMKQDSWYIFDGQRALHKAFQAALSQTRDYTLSVDFQNCVNEALEREKEQ